MGYFIMAGKTDYVLSDLLLTEAPSYTANFFDLQMPPIN